MLSKFSRILAIFPGYSKSKNSFIIPPSQKIWNLLIATIFLILFIYSFNSRILTYTQLWTHLLILDPICAISAISISIFAIIKGSSSIAIILNGLLGVEAEMNSFNTNILKTDCKLYRKLVVLHLAVVYTQFWMFYLHYFNYFTHTSFLLLYFENVQRCHIFNVIIAVEHIELSIRLQFKNVNAILRYKILASPFDVRKLRNIYVKLLRQIDDSNKVFGRLILAFFVYIVANYLICTCAVIDSDIRGQFPINGFSFSVIVVNFGLLMVSKI